MKAEKIKLKKQIDELRQKISQWNDAYFNQEKPLVADAVYDAGLENLKQLEAKYLAKYADTDFATSPTQNIGATVDSRFQKVEHKIPMLSLNKAYDLKDLQRFSDNIAKIASDFSLYCEPKIDGLSIALHYNEGELQLALTRGNGIEGEDVTHNVLEIASIPKRINYQKKLEVRGEIYLAKSDFEIINENLQAQNKQIYANARNLASGTMRQLDSAIVKERKLSSFIYSLVEPWKHEIKTYSESLEFLKVNGFVINPEGKIVKTITEAYDFVLQFEKIRKDFEYDIDGFVIKLEQFEFYNQLGQTAKFPHSAIAFKFTDDIVETTLLDIFPTIGRTGIVNYNAVLEPVFLSGTIVTAATLHNYSYIENLKISIGDVVAVKKAGEIIPKVLYSVNPRAATNFPKVTNCPFCNSFLIDSETKIDQFCINSICPEVEIRKIIHFVSKAGINVESLGEKNIRFFYRVGLVKTVTDIFQLVNRKNEIMSWKGFQNDSVVNFLTSLKQDQHLLALWKNFSTIKSALTAIENDAKNLIPINLASEQQKKFNKKQVFALLEALDKAQETFQITRNTNSVIEVFENVANDKNIYIEGFQEKSISNLFDSIQKSKNIYLHQLLNGIGIKHIGEKTAIFLAKTIPQLHQYLTYNFDDLISYNDIGPKTIQSLKDFFSDSKNIATWHQLSKIDWDFKTYKKTESKVFANLNFVITGTLSQPRKAFVEMIELQGGVVNNAVTKNTNYVLAGLEAGSKFEKAQKLNIPILTETEFLEFISKGNFNPKN
ncbi:NAD-dependent DNA ligase LigA [Candidatus Mycoplasma pogonae]